MRRIAVLCVVLAGCNDAGMGIGVQQPTPDGYALSPDMAPAPDLACPPGYLDCDGTPGCELVLFDPKNCGGCGVTCARGQACSNGACVPCTSDCDGIPDLAAPPDMASCGNGPPCSLPGAETACVNGQCLMVRCNAGFANCDHVDGNGCEVEVATNVDHCGGCGMKCSGVGIMPVCLGGQCIGNCNGGFSDCDGNKRSNGCETGTDSNDNNCGACGKTCTPRAEICFSGKCFQCGLVKTPCCAGNYCKTGVCLGGKCN